VIGAVVGTILVAGVVMCVTRRQKSLQVTTLPPATLQLSDVSRMPEGFDSQQLRSPTDIKFDATPLASPPPVLDTSS
jgi:hypothetical protein